MKEVNMKEKEYDTLRQEIMHWQARRFSVATGSSVIVTAILGWAVSAPDKWSWTVVSSILFAMLTIAGYMTWIMGLLNSRISTYLEVFHEGDSAEIGWERRHRKPERRFATSRGTYALMYFAIAVISLAISITVCRAEPTPLSIYVFGLFTASLLSALWFLVYKARPWAKYIEQWEQIKIEEIQSPTNISSSSTQQLIAPDRPQLASNQHVGSSKSPLMPDGR